jgi:hypothetical protein
LLQAVKEIGILGLFYTGATLLALYAGYEAIGLARMYGKLWIEGKVT